MQQSCRDALVLYNALAMESLGKEDFSLCLELLGRAETLSDPALFLKDDALRILTLNNFSCCFRRFAETCRDCLWHSFDFDFCRQGDLKLALKYLRMADSIGKKVADDRHVENVSATQLNLCAVLSQMGRHKDALVHARAAVMQVGGCLLYLVPQKAM